MLNTTFSRISGLIATSLSVLFVVSCSTTHIQDDPSMPTAYDQALESAALTYGAQNGLAWQAININDACNRHSRMLDRVYDFNALMLPNQLMPPVLQESKQSYHQDGFDTIRIADKIIEIVMPAGFVTTPPSWRSYLLMHHPKPEKPHAALLPTNDTERKVWDHKVNEGWTHGVKQANHMFEAALGRLNRDYTGMVLYHSLINQGMISQPYTAKADLGITGNEQKLRINDQIMRITEHSKLQTRQPSNQWNPAVVKHNHD
tara:strand:+ start:1361 stop:2140 length:780 start_codon:yes stop_codon:yes gene_type:complete